jgi:hypothetical protein
MEDTNQPPISKKPMPEEVLRSFREWFVVALRNQKIHANDSTFAVPMFNTVFPNEISKYQIDVGRLVEELSRSFWPSSNTAK